MTCVVQCACACPDLHRRQVRGRYASVGFLHIKRYNVIGMYRRTHQRCIIHRIIIFVRLTHKRALDVTYRQCLPLYILWFSLSTRFDVRRIAAWLLYYLAHHARSKNWPTLLLYTNTVKVHNINAEKGKCSSAVGTGYEYTLKSNQWHNSIIPMCVCVFFKL